MINETLEATASKVMYGGAGVAGGSLGVCILGLTKDQWTFTFGAIGALMAVCGFAFTAWLGWRRDQREERALREGK